MIEALIALAMLLATTAFVLRTFETQLAAASNANGSFVFAEWDQSVRYELGRILQRFQKRITDLSHPSLGQLPCRSASTYMKEVVDNSREAPGLSFGAWPWAAASLGPSLVDSYTKLDAYLATQSGTAAQRLKDALWRCRTRQTVHTADWTGRTTFYFCGFGTGALVEVKATFWDFTADVPLACQAMNMNPSRGVQGVYRILSFRRDGTSAARYTLKQVTGRIYVPKNLRGN